ncbi:MAG TPA: hypothetical protein VNL15_06230 [Dehalococcoidia bacterium]|nr:hypothetical protein [Dehalococcoidia bacterium]
MTRTGWLRYLLPFWRRRRRRPRRELRGIYDLTSRRQRLKLAKDLGKTRNWL